MKTLLLLLLLGTLAFDTPRIASGRYETLHLAYNPATRKVTGYFEQSGGYDENTKAPMFSCAFYLEGEMQRHAVPIRTYYPAARPEDVINGTLRVINGSEVSVKLPQEHGGCWNVQHFADEPVPFGLTGKTDWLEIRYVTAAKAYFHADTLESTRRKAYVVAGNVVYLDRRQGGWAHGRYYGKAVTAGWLKLDQLNKL
ncbi:MAG TPA: hypothetical protein VF646_08805 [Cytophagales bacterium]